MEKINIAELLKDCPKGMELDCTMFDDVKFISVENDDKPICIRTGDIYRYLTKFGTWTFDDNAKCVIFPKGKTTWEGFQRPFKDGDILVGKSGYPFIFKSLNNSNGCCSYCGLDFLKNFKLDSNDWTFADSLRFATEEERAKLFQAIKDNGYEWNAETKTLAKANKFDIKTLIPFESKVLVRDLKDGAWQPAIFGYYLRDVYPYFMAIGGFRWKYLIPYEGNEHLMGTTDDCAEFYKIWND